MVDYSDKKVQEEMEELLGALENTTFIDPLYTESWLRSASLTHFSFWFILCKQIKKMVKKNVDCTSKLV